MAETANSQTRRSAPQHESSNDVDQEEYTITHLDKGPKKWVITKIPTTRIYKQTMLSRVNILKDYKIKTLVQEFPLEEKQYHITLLPTDAIRRYQKRYSFLHIGLVQVSIVSYTSQGRDTAISLCLRDARRANLKDSILVAFESSATIDGPVHFNWYPNYSLSLSGLTNFDALVLSIKPHRYDMREGSLPLGFWYRMCYKLMKTGPESKCLTDSPKLELNTRLSNIIMPTTADGEQVILEGQMIGSSQLR